jgi:hypothetical protein
MINGQIGKIFGINLVTSDDLDCCRICGHFYMYHFNTGASVRLLPNNGQCDPLTDHGCDCKEFIPEDNLEYLEYLYDKKQA